MDIDNNDFVEFMKSLFFESYSIRYIDRAHSQSIENCSCTIATLYDANNYKHKYFSSMFDHILSEIRADFSSKEIKHIIFRIDDAIICIKPWREF